MFATVQYTESPTQYGAIKELTLRGDQMNTFQISPPAAQLILTKRFLLLFGSSELKVASEFFLMVLPLRIYPFFSLSKFLQFARWQHPEVILLKLGISTTCLESSTSTVELVGLTPATLFLERQLWACLEGIMISVDQYFNKSSPATVKVSQNQNIRFQANDSTKTIVY